MSMRARFANHLSPKTKSTIKSALRRAGLESGFNYTQTRHLRSVIAHFGINVFIDVGANMGQYGRFLRDEVGYSGKIISFEPVLSTYKMLLASSNKDQNWDCHQKGVGCKNDVLDMYVSDSSVFDSFRVQADNTGFDLLNARTEKVSVVRLDEYLSGLEGSVFLKVDTQGFDMEVIRGAQGILSRINALQTEIPFIHVYKDTVPYDKVIGELADLAGC